MIGDNYVHPGFLISQLSIQITILLKLFTDVNFCDFSEKRESFPYESFAQSINIILLPGLVLQKYYHKIHIMWIPQSLAQQKFRRLCMVATCMGDGSFITRTDFH